MSEWIKSAEAMPTPMDYVLVCDGDGVYLNYSRDGMRWEWHEEAGRQFQYWMPLPLPPEAR